VDKQQNFKTVELLVQKVKNLDSEVKMIFFPECFAFMGDGKLKGNAEYIDGELFTKYRQLAKEHNVWISYGGFPEKSNDPNDVNKGYNTHVIVDNSGDIQSKYRKLHLFDVNIPERSLRLLESETTLSGSDIIISWE
jgi:predicted amidohydrolase